MMEIREFFAREWTGAEKTLVILSCILLGVVNGFLISPVNSKVMPALAPARCPAPHRPQTPEQTT